MTEIKTAPMVNATTSWNGRNIRAALFDLRDENQKPNLSFLDFVPRPRAAFVDILMCRYGKAPARGKKFGTDSITLADGSTIDRQTYVSTLERFITVWVDRMIADGSVDVLDDGTLRRHLPPTRVHSILPTDVMWCRLCGSSECVHVDHEDYQNEADKGIPQAEWISHPEYADALREKWRLAAKADLSVGELEALLAKIAS